MSDKPQFCIQKHQSTDFHYLFRLSLGDEVISWAVPKGPSPDPRVKRLAILVSEELPMDFEGIRAKEGVKHRVIVWDSGPYTTFSLDGEPMSAREMLREGKLEFHINGSKLKGGFTLIRVEDSPNERWLLMKNSDAEATTRRNPVVTEPLSVISGRDLGDVEE